MSELYTVKESSKIGVVDESAADRDWVCEKLSFYEPEIVEYLSIEEAINCIKEIELDAILVSVTQDGFQGESTLRKLRGCHPRAALILLDDYDDGTLSQLGADSLCQDILLRHEVTSLSLQRAISLAVQRFRVVEESLELQKRLAEVAEHRAQFASLVSHEIMNPMTGLMGYLQILSRTELDQNQKQYVSVVKNSCQALTDLVKDLLALSKIEQGAIAVESVAFSPHELSNQIDLLVRAQFDLSEVQLFSLCDSRLPTLVRGDRVKMRQVLYNLIQNALKFTEQGRVIASMRLLSETEDRVKIRMMVEDSGCGIPEDKIDEILKPFSQARSSDSHRGHGLGLTLVNRYLGLLGSRLMLASEEGKGSVFWADIELARTAEAADLSDVLPDLRVLLLEAEPVAGEFIAEALEYLGATVRREFSEPSDLNQVDLILGSVSDHNFKNLFENPRLPLCKKIGYGASVEQVLDSSHIELSGCLPMNRLVEHLVGLRSRRMPEAAISSSTSRGSALVVDDDRICADYLKLELEAVGFQVQVANSGAEALNHARNSTFDLITLDGQLGDMTCLRLYRRLWRDQLIDGKVKIVIVTGNPDSWRESVRGSDSGVKILGKPLCPQALRSCLDGTSDNDFDDGRLSLLKPLGPEMMERLATAFREDLAVTIDQLHEAKQNSDNELIKSLAHRIRGAASTVGASRMARLATEVENLSEGSSEFLSSVECLCDYAHQLLNPATTEGEKASESHRTQVAI